MEESILGLIRVKYHILSPAQKVIADYILSNTQHVIILTLSALAQACNTSETTIIRFLRKLNYDSYQVFRVKIAQELSADSTTSIYEEVKADDSIGEIKKKVIQVTMGSINDLNNILDEKQLIAFTEAMVQAKRIIFIGVGASSMIAADAYHKFLRLGLHVVTCNDSHIISIQCTHVNKDDFVVAISHSGESREILEAVKLAKEKGAKLACITSFLRSSLSKLMDIVLLSSARESEYRSDAMISRILQLVIIDTLYISTVLKLGPTSIKHLNESRLAVAKKKT